MLSLTTTTQENARASYVPTRVPRHLAHELPAGSVAVVLGTRPELIKMSVLLRMLGTAAQLVHTGQHYEPVLAEGLLYGGSLPQPAVQLDAGGRSRGEQIGATVGELTRRWSKGRPKLVLVHGDTNATLAGALAANALGLPLIHAEAGLRSYDRAMPEEHNRVLVDHLADLCCAPTPDNVANLRAEAIPSDRITLTGNTIVEALTGITRNRSAAEQTLSSLDVHDKFVLATLHRPENVDNPARLHSLLETLANLSLPVVLALHPRTRHHVPRKSDATASGWLRLTEPLAYPTFLALAEMSTALVSDSGGIQEEASLLKKPLLVVRRSTERPEVLGSFATLITDPRDLRQALQHQIGPAYQDLQTIPTPFGDGLASSRILQAATAIASAGRDPHEKPQAESECSHKLVDPSAPGATDTRSDSQSSP